MSGQPDMDAARAAYWNLISLARTDGPINDSERYILDRYRSALGLFEGDTLPIQAEALREKAGATRVAGSPEERKHVLRMMARVAWADGALTPAERRRLERLAVALDIGPVEYADLLVTVQQEILGPRRAARRVGLRIASLVLVLGVAAALWARHSWRSDLSRNTVASPKRVVEKFDRSVFLLYAQCTLRRGSEERSLQGWGTGFLVSSDGCIVTCKHVVQPWKFGEGPALIAQGFELDERRYAVAAWANGAACGRTARGIDLGAAYSTVGGTLSVVVWAPDRFTTTEIEVSDDRTVRAQQHAHDNVGMALAAEK